MAEDEVMGEVEGGMAARQQKNKVYKTNYEECNVRLDELSKPRKWYLLSTYQENQNRFDPERLDKMRVKIQEEFSLTPEETEKYMEKFKKKIRTDIRKRELIKEMKRQKKLAKRKAYLLFRKYIKRGMMFACEHSPPPIVSPVVNAVSEAILKILCEIHVCGIPSRRDNDKISQFLLANADWLAIAICSIYYDVEIEEKQEMEKLKGLERRLTIEKEMERRPPKEEGEGEGEDEDEDENEFTEKVIDKENLDGDDSIPATTIGDTQDIEDIEDVEDIGG